MQNNGLSLGILSATRLSAYPPFCSQTESFMELIQVANRKGCLSYVFTIDDIRWDNHTILGYVPNNTYTGWNRCIFPLPTVIYNRLPNRAIEQTKEHQSLLKKLILLYKNKFFNPFFLNKWSVYNILKDNIDTNNFIPKTCKFSETNLHKMMDKYNAVYLKPIESSLGLGIFKIYKDPHDQRFYFSSNRRTAFISNLSMIKEKRPNLPFFYEPYLIQQAIDLAELDNRPVDYRVLFQKNKKGKWVKTGLAARIAGEGKITTHVMYNGSRASAEMVLQESFGINIRKKISQNISYCGKTAAGVLEKASKLAFGELEMDIGVDKSGKPWIIEINSKPFKFDEPLLRAKSLIHLIDYVGYLKKTPQT